MKRIAENINELIADTAIQRCNLFGNGVIGQVEDKLCNYYDKKYAITFPNATTAIWAVCLALELKKKVIASSSFGWAGAIAPFLFLENELTFPDTDDSLNLRAEACAFDDNNIDAIFSIDFGGTPADTKQLKEIASKKDAFLISDSSQSLGAYRNGKPAGYWADIIILSFTSSKAISCFEGGAIITDDKELFQNILSLSQHPYRQKISLGVQSFNEFLPLNGRMNPLSAIVFTDTFEIQMMELAKVQSNYFNLYQKLQRSKIIKEVSGFHSHDFSTFFEFLVEPASLVPELIEKLNFMFPNFYFQKVELKPFSLRNGFYQSNGFKKVTNNQQSEISRIKINFKT